MSNEPRIREGQILTGPQFEEPMRVVTATANLSDTWSIGAAGVESGIFRRVTLTADDLEKITITDDALSYAGDGKLLWLGLQAHILGIAYEFDPYFGLSISRVDPLPHQLEAVYEHLLKLPHVRFLLADDAGAGKTIMAGLLIRELKLRGLVVRVLVVCPSNLTFQWQRELREKFDEKFTVLKGGDIRDQFGINQWLEKKQIITSLDLAKRDEILPGLRQVRWDLVIVDEAHRMSWSPPAGKTARYALGELLRDNSDHILLLTATPHKGDPKSFTQFLQLLDRDAYADVSSIHEAMKRQRAPFYLRRTKEAMVYFPKRQDDGKWAARPVFTRRIPHTAGFKIDGPEFDLYQEVSRFVRRCSARAAERGDDRRARAVGFLMSLYQRRLASSIHAMGRSLENRVRRLTEGLEHAHQLAQTQPPTLPDLEDLEEMEEGEREKLEQMLEAITLTETAEQVREEIAELEHLAADARKIRESGEEAKLSRLREIMQKHGFFDHPDQRLLIFTEFKDTLNYLLERLQAWGFRTGCIHGGMKPGSRDERGTRLHAEQAFRDGDIQVLVATEAAGEGINLQCCHILFNYDIPWNPNRLEQRMGRIHRYGQRHDCLIFNFVATNTIEGRVLQRLLEKLQEIRNALDDDAVFNVVGEVLPAATIEHVFREFYAGRLDENGLEQRLFRDMDEGRFRDICQTALEGLASKTLNLDMLTERRALAQERRVVPETIARFLRQSADLAGFGLRPVAGLPHTFDPQRTPPKLRNYESRRSWKLAPVAQKYPRLSTDRQTAETKNLEWVTPGHPLFEALRQHDLDLGRDALAAGACFHSLEHEAPARLDIYRAQVVDGLGRVIHKRLFVAELAAGAAPAVRELDVLGNMTPAPVPTPLPDAAALPEAEQWLQEHVLLPFLENVKAERLEEVQRIAKHVELSLTAILARADEEIGHAQQAVEDKVQGAQGRLAQAGEHHDEISRRRARRREELGKQQALTLQGVERMTSVLILPHPERDALEVRNLRPNAETEAVAMEVVMAHERARGCKVEDIHLKNLGYDLTSLNAESGELRLIEVKGLAAASGSILLTPNERRVAEDRRDCYWLYVVTGCASAPVLQKPVLDPASRPWHEVSKVQHYWLGVDALTQPMELHEEQEPFRHKSEDTS